MNMLRSSTQLVLVDANPKLINALLVETIVPITFAYFFFFFNAVVHVTRDDRSQVGGCAPDWAFVGAWTFIGGGGFGSVCIGSNCHLGFRTRCCDL